MKRILKKQLLNILTTSSLVGGFTFGKVFADSPANETDDTTLLCPPAKDMTIFSVSKDSGSRGGGCSDLSVNEKCASNVKEQVRCLCGVDPKTRIRVDSNECPSCPITKTENFSLGKDDVSFIDKLRVYERVENPTKKSMPCCSPCEARGSEECDGPRLLRKYQMLKSQVFFRHGARTPLQHIPNLEEVFYNKEFLLMPVPYTEVPFIVCNLNGGPRPVAALEKKYETIRFLGDMYAGQLTHLGRDQMYCLGRKLRRKYMERWELLPECFLPDEISLRSTNINRSIDSMQCICAGLWGEALQRTSPLRIQVAAGKDEILYPQLRYCKALRGIEKLGDIMQDEIAGFKRTSLLINRQLNLNEKPWFMVFRDNIICRMAHGLHVPSWLDTIAPQIDRIATQVLCYLMAGPPQSRENGLKLSIGPVLDLILKNFEDDSKKFKLYSVHDSTLVPLLLSLDCFDNQWPSFACDLCFDLLQDRQSGEKMVRVTYNGRGVKIGNSEEQIIPYSSFQSILGKYAVDGEQHKTACMNKEFHNAIFEAIKCEREKRNERICITEDQLNRERERCKAMKLDEQMRLNAEQNELNMRSTTTNPCKRATECQAGCPDCIIKQDGETICIPKEPMNPFKSTPRYDN